MSSSCRRAVVGEVVDVGFAQRVERAGAGGDHPGNLKRVVARRHHRRAAGLEFGPGPSGIDLEVVDDRFHREGQRIVELGLHLPHDRRDQLLELVMPVRERRRRPCLRPTSLRA